MGDHYDKVPGTYQYSTPDNYDTPELQGDLKGPNTYSSPELPAPPSGHALPPAQGPAPTPPGQSGPADLDAAIDAMLAKNGGRISSREMRALELQFRGGGGGGSTPAPQAAAPALSPTELKRQAIMSKIPKTKTKDSEGGDLTFAGRDGEGLAGKQLVDHYKGEDKGVTWRAGSKDKAAATWGLAVGTPEFDAKWNERVNSDKLTTQYDTTPAERETSRLKETGGGEVETTHDLRNGNYDRSESGWVMDPSSGSVHTFDPTRMTEQDGKKKTTHHSSPLAGGNVAGAGMLKTKDGHITKVTDESGHYRPEGEYTYQAVREMASRGLLDRDADEDEVDEHESGEGNLSAKVSLAGYVENDPRQQKGWLKDQKDIYTGELKMPYQAFLQTRGNERQARAKHAMHGELHSKVPMVGEDPGSKAVRKGGAPASSLGAPGPGAPHYVDYKNAGPADHYAKPVYSQLADLEGAEGEAEEHAPNYVDYKNAGPADHYSKPIYDDVDVEGGEGEAEEHAPNYLDFDPDGPANHYAAPVYDDVELEGGEGEGEQGLNYVDFDPDRKRD